ncbi:MULTISPECIES: YggT family protein [Vagococcus]|uniref:YggT family protein n=1 Tax=Vagococcus TaxID=2737 RepID=UPI000B36195E|nr:MULTISPECIES: YggT family protein [Vagococcus]HCM89347.1 YggT family protein [Vagococcus sp.]
MLIINLLMIFLKAVEIYSFVLIAYALLSWFPGAYESKIGQFIIKISRPYLSLFDRLPLSFGPIDFTIIVAVIALQLVSNGLAKLVTQLVFGY